MQPVWETLLGQQLEPIWEARCHLKDTRHYGGKGVITLPNTVNWTLPNTVNWMQVAVLVLSWCLSTLEKADFPSRLQRLYWPNLHQLQQELRCLDFIWTPNVRCQNFAILISHWIASCMYWIGSHRPQVEKGTITMSCASRRSPRYCFLLSTLNKTGIYLVLQDNVCYEKARLQEHKGCKVQTKKAAVEKAITHAAKPPP